MEERLGFQVLAVDIQIEARRGGKIAHASLERQLQILGSEASVF